MTGNLVSDSIEGGSGNSDYWACGYRNNYSPNDYTNNIAVAVPR